MDNKELHYLSYDIDEIWREMLMTYMDNSHEVILPGDEKYMLLEGVKKIIVQVFAGVDNALRMATLRYAVGDYLDVIGENRGCERMNAEKANAVVSVNFIQSGVAKTIPAGTALSADGKVQFVLENDLEQSGNEETIGGIAIIAKEAGETGNCLVVGTPMSFTQTQSAVNSIYVTEEAQGGKDKEHDDDYRERIRQHGLAITTTGASERYEDVARSVSANILDAKALNSGDGIVSVYLILENQTGSSELIQKVREALNDKEMRPLTDTVTVGQATNVNYTLNVEYTAPNNTDITNAVEKAVIEYQIWQDRHIGVSFNPDRLMAAIYQAGAQRVTWGAGSEFDGGTVEYTDINQDERCFGTITLNEV